MFESLNSGEPKKKKCRKLKLKRKIILKIGRDYTDIIVFG